MIKNIVFDIGQVLANFRWKEYIEDFGFSKDINERIGKVTVLSPLWKEVDRGAWSKEEIIKACIDQDPEIEEELRIFFKDRSKMVVEYPYAKDWILQLKEKGYHVYLLSNYGEDSFASAKDVFTFLKVVDGAVISYQEKCIKPEPKIYEILLNRYHLLAKETVFIDDIQENLIAAAHFGIYTVHFKNIEQAKVDLAKLDVIY